MRVHDLRDGADDQRRSVDDSPFGGGAGMVLMAEPVFRSVEAVPGRCPGRSTSCRPRRTPLRPGDGAELAGSPAGFSLLCGRYEGVDQRVADHLCDGELSVGDFVLAGGELAALVVVEAVARLLPGVLGNEESTDEESFASGLLEYPQYTRPAEFRGWAVPEVLRSGDHGAVAGLAAGAGAGPDVAAPSRPHRRRGGLTEEEVRLLVAHGEVRLLSDHGYD